LVYTIPVPAGTYKVTLEILELWNGITAAGQRVFNAIVNGQAINNIDPFRTGGGLMKDAFQTLDSVSAPNGVISITLKRVIQNPTINGIVIIPLSASGGGGGNTGTAPVFKSTPPTVKAIPFGTWTYTPSATGATSWALATSSVSSIVSVSSTTGVTTLRATNTQAGKSVAFGLNACNTKGCTTQNLNVAVDDAPIRVNLGSTTNFISSDGLTWRADTNSSFGLVTTNSNANPGNVPAALVQVQRFAPPPTSLVYRFTPPTTGNYIVEIIGCEIFSGALAVGKRLLNINVQGLRAFTNVDWFARGGTSAVTLQVGVSITSTSTPIIIEATRVVENPMIAALAIRFGTAPPPTPPPTTCTAPFVVDGSGDCVSSANGCSAFSNQWDCARGCVDTSKGGVFNVCQGGTCRNGKCAPHSLTTADVSRLRGIVDNFLNGGESRELATANLAGLQPGDEVGAIVRLAFHAVSTRVAEACVMVFPCTSCEFNNAHNSGLQNIVQALRNLYHQNNLWSVITMTDWTFLVTAQTVTHASRGQINPTYRWGRTQCRCMTTVPTSSCAGGVVNTAVSSMPEPENTLSQIQAIMEGGFGFTGTEWRCLLGAHALGRAMPNNTGYARHWTNTPNVLDNSYAVTLADTTLPWSPEPGVASPGFTSPATGRTQYCVTGQTGQGRMMLKSDIRSFWSADGANDNCQLTHGGNGCPPLSELGLLNTWASSPSTFFTCFKGAFEKLINLRQNGLKAPV
jgi:hypothetical protein